jgi:hypothetical protein
MDLSVDGKNSSAWTASSIRKQGSVRADTICLCGCEPSIPTDTPIHVDGLRQHGREATSARTGVSVRMEGLYLHK